MCQELEHKILSVQKLGKIKMVELGIFLVFFILTRNLRLTINVKRIWQFTVYIIQLVVI